MEQGQANVHAAWRMGVARRAALLDDVVLNADTDPVKHMRLAALQAGDPAARRGPDRDVAGARRRLPKRSGRPRSC
jgi:hypothetical protein